MSIAYCTTCHWRASDESTTDLNRAMIAHHAATGHQVEREDVPDVLETPHRWRPSAKRVEDERRERR